MSLLNASNIRVKCDTADLGTATDQATGLPVKYTRGDTVNIEVLLVQGGVPVAKDELDYITVDIRPANSPSGQPVTYISRVIPHDKIRPMAGTGSEMTAWESGGSGHGTVSIAAANALLPSGQYRLLVQGHGEDGSVATYLGAVFMVVNPAGVDTNDTATLVLALASGLTASLSAASAAAIAAQEASEAAQANAEGAQDAAEAAAAALAIIASQPDAEAGMVNNKMMTPLRTLQHIAASEAIVHRTGAEDVGGAKNFTDPVTVAGLTSAAPIVSAVAADADTKLPNLGQVKGLLQRKFPLAADFPSVDGAAPDATMLDNANNGLLVNYGVGLANNQAKYVYRAITASGDWTATARILLNAPQQTGIFYGITLRSSAANAAVCIGWRELNNFSIHKTNASTGANTSTVQGSINCGSMLQWVRVKFIQSTSTYEVYLSPDGQYWWRMGSYTATTFFGAGNLADGIGIGMDVNETSGREISVSVPYWESDA